MYKIYIHDTPIFLVNTDFIQDKRLIFDQKLVARYNGKTKSLLQYIDMLEKTDRYDAIIIYHSHVKELFKDFKSLYKIIKAAGGLVYNNKGEVLMIYRRNFWDLPKGKIDPGEKKKEAAIREVQEETGLEEVTLIDRLLKTLHTYRKKDGTRILKYTYWYTMKTPEHQLTPQVEEDIEKAVWRYPKEFFNSGDKAYGSIVDVLEEPGHSAKG